MNVQLKLTLMILCLVLSLTLIIIVIYLCFTTKKKYRIYLINRLKDRVNEEILLKFDRIIIQIKKIAQQNDQYIDLLEHLIKIYDSLEDSWTKIKRSLKDCYQSINYALQKEFKKSLKILRDNVEEFEVYNQNFENLTNKFTKKDQFIRSQMVFLKNCLRKVIYFYKENRIVLNNISSKIDQLLRDSNELEKKFENTLNLGKTNHAIIYLDKYEKQVLNLAHIIDQGPIIKNHLYKIIPQKAKNLIQKYDPQIKDLNLNIKIIDTHKHLHQIIKIYKQARSQYELLDFDNVKLTISACYRDLNNLEKKMKLELKAKEFLFENQKTFIQELKTIFLHYFEVKNKYHQIVSEGSQSSFELIDKFEELNWSKKTIEDDYQNNLKLSSKGHSYQLLMIKSLLIKMIQFKKLINQIEVLIWKSNFETIIYKNKFHQLDNAINQLLIDIKSKKLVLNDYNQKNLDSTLEEIAKISLLIANKKIDLNLKKIIDDLIIKVTNLYPTINGELQIAQMIENILNELSSKRSLDKQLNYVLVQVEKDYTQGKYSQGLNQIINYLGENKYVYLP